MYKIPTYNCNSLEWSHTEFLNNSEFLKFLTPLFKYPGKYNFNRDYLVLLEQANVYKKRGFYCEYPNNSSDFIKYWDTEKDKCRNGLIIHSTNGEAWYITRDYYMWVNFLPIHHKELKINIFPNLYDGQYHAALYEWIGELLGLHAVMLKKRQYAMSYFHMAKLINQLWFEEGVTLKLLAYLDAYIGLEGSWGFLNEYKDFLNEHTAWYRNMDPSGVGKWQQRVQANINGRDGYKGLKGRLLSVTTQQSSTKGVGGASRYIVAEESGINPTLDKTYGYAKSALELGPTMTTGQFIAYGSVGDLKQCEPLKKFILNPTKNGFFGVDTYDYDDSGMVKNCGLFIPVHWNLPGYTDEYGNTDIDGAKKAILTLREQQKKDLDPADYQLTISQNPLTIKEAFDYRDESVFPLGLIAKQIRRIEEKEYFMEYVDLERDESNRINIKPSNRHPITEFPVSKTDVNKEGVVVLYERPIVNPQLTSTYYASIDPVSIGKSTTSESLFSILVYKTTQDVTIVKDNGEIENRIEQDKIVASWCGRFDDVNKTNELGSMIVELYNAWTLVENNVSGFIQYMISKRRQKYLVPKSQIAFLKELQSNNTVYEEYGWKNTGTIFKANMIPYAIQFMQEELFVEEFNDGNIKKITYGVERIPDIMILKEMIAYRDGMNVDRLISFCALCTFAIIQQSNRGYSKRHERQQNLEKPKESSNFKVNPFRHIGGNGHFSQSINIRKNSFKNLR